MTASTDRRTFRLQTPKGASVANETNEQSLERGRYQTGSRSRRSLAAICYCCPVTHCVRRSLFRVIVARRCWRARLVLMTTVVFGCTEPVGSPPRDGGNADTALPPVPSADSNGDRPDQASSNSHDVPMTPTSPADAPTDITVAEPSERPADRMATPLPMPDGQVPDSRPCTTGPEYCFNSEDDDCDGDVDCADTDCTNDRARCMPDGTIGLMVADAMPCPMGYQDVDRTLGYDLRIEPCTGCSCSQAQVTCSAHVRFFRDDALDQCQTGMYDPTGSGWYSTNVYQSEGCKAISPSPIVGLTVVLVEPVRSSCTPSGRATRGGAAWRYTTRFCGSTRKGSGCGAGRVCTPVQTPDQRPCQLLPPGQTTCPQGTRPDARALYESFTDNRTCGPCECGAATGGSCPDVKVALGANASCASPTLVAGLKETRCGSALMNPSAVVTATPTPGACPPTSVAAGQVVPTGPRTVCCLATL